MTEAEGSAGITPAGSPLSQAALLMSVAGAVLAALIAWRLFSPILQGPLLVASVVGWLTLSLAALVLGLVQLLRPYQRHRQPAVAAGLAAASLVVVVLAAAGAAGLLPGGSLKSDDELIATFSQHGPEFTEAMAEYEDHSRVDNALLRRLGVDPLTVWKDQDGVVYLPVSTEGLAVSGADKGYAYSEKPLTPLVDRTDGYHGGDGSGFLVFRHIRGPWYVYYDRTT
jgi:hypothetical protein